MGLFFKTGLTVKTLSILAATSFTALPQMAQAQAQGSHKGAYVNLGASILSADFNLEDVNLQGTNAALEDETANIFIINGRLGYRLNKYIAAEVEGGFGLGGDSVEQSLPIDTGVIGVVDVNLDANLNINSYGAGFIRGILPVSQKFDLFVRGGYGVAGAEVDLTATTALLAGTTVSDNASDTIDGFTYGVGAEYHINDKHGVRLDFTAINSEDVDVLFFGAAYSYKF